MPHICACAVAIQEEGPLGTIVVQFYTWYSRQTFSHPWGSLKPKWDSIHNIHSKCKSVEYRLKRGPHRATR